MQAVVGLSHPAQKIDWAVRVYVVFTLLILALAPAYRRQCKQAAKEVRLSACSSGGASAWTRPEIK
jgi:hypothetical protein